MRESYCAFLDLVFRRLRVRSQRIDAPVLVLGAEQDGFFTARELGRTAQAYGTKTKMFQGMGHDMMLDQGWEEVADLIDAWARDIETPRPARAPRDALTERPALALNRGTSQRP